MDSNEMLQKMLDNLPEKTGKSLTEWKNILKKQNFTKHSEGLNFLKKEHHVTHGYANTIVALFREDGKEEIDLVKEQYKGKESLKPIYDRILEEVKKFGTDIIITPKKQL